MSMIVFILKITMAYLLGSVSGSLLLGKFRKVDIRQQGSGSAGSTNAFRTQGLWFAFGVIIIDVSKGFIAAWWIPSLNIGASVQEPDFGLLVMACGLAAILGHCFPIWHGFRGGKGAATAVGALIVIETWLLLPALIIWLMVLLISGYVGLSTVLAGFSMVPAAWFLGDRNLLVFASIVALFLLFTHRRNISKLRSGTEHRFNPRRSSSRKQ